MGDKGCARSSGRGAGGSGRGSFVEVARSSWFPNVLLGVCGLRVAAGSPDLDESSKE